LGARLFNILQDVPGFDAATRVASLTWRKWALGALPQDWNSGIEQWALAVMAPGPGEGLPIPRMAVALLPASPPEGPHPWEPLVRQAPVVLYEWGGYPGVYAPLLGEELTLCLGQDDRRWYAATQERLIAALVGAKKASPSLDADLVLRVDWQRAAEAGRVIVPEAAQAELIPGMNEQDAAKRLDPALDAIGLLGVVEIKGVCSDNRLEFSGFLAHGEEADAES
jgi:hypothetical protein